MVKLVKNLQFHKNSTKNTGRIFNGAESGNRIQCEKLDKIVFFNKT